MQLPHAGTTILRAYMYNNSRTAIPFTPPSAIHTRQPQTALSPIIDVGKLPLSRQFIKRRDITPLRPLAQNARYEHFSPIYCNDDL